MHSPTVSALAMQRPVDDGVVDWTADSGLVSSLYWGYHQHASSGSLFQKRSQQFPFLLEREVLTMTAAQRFSPQHVLTLTEISRVYWPHRAYLPAQGYGDLCGSKTQGSSHPHTLNPLIVCLAFRLFQHRC